MTITANVLLDSINPDGTRLTTLELHYPLSVHNQLLTHRDLSRSSASNRAIPTARLCELVNADPALPSRYGANQRGMQALANMTPFAATLAEWSWRVFAKLACLEARWLAFLGLHKQWANRWLQPCQHVTTIVTACEWSNFFDQRIHADAQDEMCELAVRIRDAIAASEPTPLAWGFWHAPYGVVPATSVDALLISAARCARVSYLGHDGMIDVKRDMALAYRLLKDRHMSPFEHVAQAAPGLQAGNFKAGWRQLRHHEFARVS